MESYFINNSSVNIHVLENGVPSSKTPSLLVIGGLWEPAERAIPILSGLSSHVVALSLRGRGLSSTPEVGYDLSDHLSDIESVVKHCQLKNYCVLGFSRGASYALGWSLKNQQNMSGLILVDQPPVHSKQSEESVEYWSNLVYQGVSLLNFMRRKAIEGLARDVNMVDFSSDLTQLNLPVAFFVGRNEKASIPSNVSDETLELYKNTIHSCEIIEFLQSGHMIPDEEQQKYISEIASFIKKIERK
ncbi:Pimeloyl-ACP methyl ester carboxylesterase [Clostridium acidisoli DSM 12555]|uniref:Pimeloyl-ACP methyl ester carboxylesterase n=1 Tax=Clostridium acidisoli DSM 12555 TaxID=1121291 RepID=A0A1W1X4S1_9CLOT|nr:alpha/beta hydrolase [Clostridium acidisoli]SMC18718.1 Pimeloyl-ACP methyl ester carboxylesterase [Clostridium acidisoli DSM 12555]